VLQRTGSASSGGRLLGASNVGGSDRSLVSLSLDGASDSACFSWCDGTGFAAFSGCLLSSGNVGSSDVTLSPSLYAPLSHRRCRR